MKELCQCGCDSFTVEILHESWGVLYTCTGCGYVDTWWGESDPQAERTGYLKGLERAAQIADGMFTERLDGAGLHISDAIRFASALPATDKKENEVGNREKLVLDKVREWLKSGATISATDVNGKILEIMDDGSCFGGCTVTSKSDSIPATDKESLQENEKLRKWLADYQRAFGECFELMGLGEGGNIDMLKNSIQVMMDDRYRLHQEIKRADIHKGPV